MPRARKNIGASVRARLLNIARATSQDFELVLMRYAIERLLYRLAESQHADRFVLKGAMLLMTWFNEPVRSTRDLDFLGLGDSHPQSVVSIFKEMLSTEYPDGVHFNADQTRLELIREHNEYGGLRIRTEAVISGARVPIKIDVGYGDSTEPGVEPLDYPVILDMPVPHLRGYAPETVVAEKFHAIVEHGSANTRLKDYFDLWMLSKHFDFKPPRLAKAISATFARRGTPVPEDMPEGLSQAFANNEQKLAIWKSLKRSFTVDPGSLAEVVDGLNKFLMQAAQSARRAKN